jgi:hypothetical protein
MAGLDLNRLVLVITTLPPGAPAKFRTGTGYFVTSDLVLTASHVVPKDAQKIEVRVENGGEFLETELGAVWRDEQLDAVLIRRRSGIVASDEVKWLDRALSDNAEWSSTGYPLAAQQQQDSRTVRKTAGLGGTLYAQGGGGQGIRQLELGVKDPPDSIGWSGVSGAPVFVGDLLAGVIKSVPDDFGGKRLSGVPADVLLDHPSFRLAIAPPWIEWPRNEPWVLVLLSEHATGDLRLTMESAISSANESLTRMGEEPLHVNPVVRKVTDVLQEPGRWLQFVRAMCAATVMVVDVSGNEPGIMLLLGVRAVVRRGLTIPTLGSTLDETHLAELPFNIQETKLLSHSDTPVEESKHPVYVISNSIRDGLLELRSHPRYLDLPAYDAVRCPEPETLSDVPSARDTILVLCSFQEIHRQNWKFIRSRAVYKYPGKGKRIVRMLDVSSPKLVGQTLYETIRWTTTCIVDWTGWRANVFFEMGVRLACSDIVPACIIEKSDANAGHLTQMALLKRLFAPAEYEVGIPGTLDPALAAHVQVTLGRPQRLTDGALRHGDTFRLANDFFDWNLERITRKPHELLRASAEAELGKDPQKRGYSPVLFSLNPEFGLQLRRSVQERWAAAWYYLRNRYANDFATDANLRAELKELGEAALQWIPKSPGDKNLQALRDEIEEEVDKLEMG